MMRQSFIYIILSALCLVACNGQDDEVMSSGRGYVLLGDIMAEAANEMTVTTRAVDADLQVDILSEDGSTVKHFEAGDAMAGQKIELQTGNYTLHVYNGVNPNEAACYDGQTTFTIHPEKTTYVNLSVPMTNAAFQLQLPEQFDTWFTNYEFSVTKDGTKYILTTGNTLYIDIANGDELAYQLAAINADGELRTQQGSIIVAPGHLYFFTYDFSVNAVRASVL